MTSGARPPTARRGGPPPIIFVVAVVGLLAGLGADGPLDAGRWHGPRGHAEPRAARRVDCCDRPGGHRRARRAVDPGRPARSVPIDPLSHRPSRRRPAPCSRRSCRPYPAHGYVVVYELPTDDAAAAAGREFAAYLASGVGRVQFPTDTRFTLRQVGDTLVFFDWSPANWPDERSATIQQALETVGTPIPIAS